jgi:hypothetical protein
MFGKSMKAEELAVLREVQLLKNSNYTQNPTSKLKKRREEAL